MSTSDPAKRIFQAARDAIRRSPGKGSESRSSPRQVITAAQGLRGSVRKGTGQDEAEEEVQKRQQEGLEEASRVCAQGRQDWTENKPEEALEKFEQALRLLEGLLGTYHALTAKTYYWLGFIRKHDESTYDLALQDFLQTARIRLVLLGPSHDSTQEAIAAISWVLHSQGGHPPEFIKDYLTRLHESIRLETLGDARLRHRAYDQAIAYYKQAMETFEDIKHATILGKRAFSSFQVGEAISLSIEDQGKTFDSGLPFSWVSLRTKQDDSETKTRYLDEALGWYRQAIMTFSTQTVHRRDHPDLPTTVERMRKVLNKCLATNYITEEITSIETYLSQDLFTSIEAQHNGQKLLKGTLTRRVLEQAKQSLTDAYSIEKDFYGQDHPIALHLYGLIAGVQQRLDDYPSPNRSPETNSQRNLSFQARGSTLDQSRSIGLSPSPTKTTSPRASSPLSPMLMERGGGTNEEPLNSESDLIALVETLQAQVDSLSSQAETWRKEKQQLLNRLQSLETERKELQTQSEHSRLDVMELEDHWKKAQVIEADLKAQLAVNESKMRLMAKEHEDETEKALAQLRHKVGILELELVQSKDQVLASQQTTTLLHEKLTSQEALIQQWRSKVDEQQSLLKESQDALAKQNQKVQELQEQSRIAVPTEEQTVDPSLELKLQHTKHALAKVEAQLTSVQANAASLQKMKEYSEKKLEEFQAEQSKLLQALEDKNSKIDRLQNQLEHFIQEKNGNNPSGKEYKSSLDSLKMTMQYERELQKSEKQIEELHRELKSLKVAKEKDQDQISSMQAEKANVNEALERLRKELDHIKGKNLRLESNLQKVHQALGQKQQRQQPQEQSVTVNSQSRSAIVHLTASSTDEISLVASSSIDTTETPRTLDEDLRMSLQTTPWKFHSDQADYTIRRPLPESDLDGLDDAMTPKYFPVGHPCQSTSDYLEQGAGVAQPSSLDVLVKVAVDGSSLYVLGNGHVYHRFADGTWGIQGRSILDPELDDPLGWITVTTATSSTDRTGHKETVTTYSLDSLVEEAQLFRDQYAYLVLTHVAELRGGAGNSTTITTKNSKNKKSDSVPKYVGYLADQVHTSGPLFDLPTLVLVSALLVAAFAIVLAHYK